MDHGKVVTQVVSQMIPLHTMYGVQNVYGILSTYSSWRFFKWVPGDEKDAVSGNLTSVEEAEKGMHNVVLPQTQDTVSNNAFQTPQKKPKKSPRKTSPPISPSPYVDSDDVGNDKEEYESAGSSSSEVCRGIVYASDILPAGPEALKTLAWVLGEMANSPIVTRPAHERDHLYVVQKSDDGTIGGSGFEKLSHTTDYYKSRPPNANNTKLYLLDELGHRYHGRVYRAMSKNGNLCVLKFFSKSQHCRNELGTRVERPTDIVARTCAAYWNKAFSNWLPKAVHGKWGGGYAIVMPDLERVTAEIIEYDTALRLLEISMREQFFDKGLWHGDAAWRNVAFTRNKQGEVTKVFMIDLEPDHMIEDGEPKWSDFNRMWSDFKQTLEKEWVAFRDNEVFDGAGNSQDDEIRGRN